MLLDPLRRQWVADTPEERVRQALIAKMIGDLGFPQKWMAVEKDVASLPLAKTLPDPNRRLDLICYTSVKKQIVPLLIVECKAEKLDEGAASQVFGYNAMIGAPFVCLASANEIKTMWREFGEIRAVSFLPSYEQLVEKICLL